MNDTPRQLESWNAQRLYRDANFSTKCLIWESKTKLGHRGVHFGRRKDGEKDFSCNLDLIRGHAATRVGNLSKRSKSFWAKYLSIFLVECTPVHSLHCDSQLCIIKLIKSLTIFSRISQQLKKGLNWIDLSFCFANCEEAIQPLPFANYHLLAFDVDAQRKASLVFSYQGGKISLPEKICWPIWRKKYVDQFSKK